MAVVARLLGLALLLHHCSKEVASCDQRQDCDAPEVSLDSVPPSADLPTLLENGDGRRAQRKRGHLRGADEAPIAGEADSAFEPEQAQSGEGQRLSRTAEGQGTEEQSRRHLDVVTLASVGSFQGGMSISEGIEKAEKKMRENGGTDVSLVQVT